MLLLYICRFPCVCLNFTHCIRPDGWKIISCHSRTAGAGGSVLRMFVLFQFSYYLSTRKSRMEWCLALHIEQQQKKKIAYNGVECYASLLQEKSVENNSK